MSEFKKAFLGIFLGAVALLILGNPDEERFLNKVAMDYGAMHGGMNMETNKLLEFGQSERNSYLFFSTYSYEFGNIGVRYFGIGYQTFFVGSYAAIEYENKEFNI